VTIPRRVNKTFTNPLAFKRSIPSGNSFDEVVAHLHLSPDQYRYSVALEQWVRRNKNDKYVPTDVLKTFGFEAE